MQIETTYMSLGNVSGLEERSYHVEFVVMPARESEREREKKKYRREERERNVSKYAEENKSAESS